MKCYKCGGKTALVQVGIRDRWRCLPCLYDINHVLGKNIMPFLLFELDKICKNKKWTSLRSLKYDKFPFEKIRVYIKEDNIHTIEFIDGAKYYGWLNKNDILTSEGFSEFKFEDGGGFGKIFSNWGTLITALKKKRHRLPKEMYLYDLRKPIEVK